MNYSVSLSRQGSGVPVPPAPRSIAETGLKLGFLVDLLIKTVFRHGLERPSQMAAELRLPRAIIETLIESATSQQLMQILGQPGADFAAEMRYQLTVKGRDWARNALEAGGWVGPAPVPIEQFVRQIEAHVTNTLGWSATTAEVEPWVYQRLSETFVLDPEMRRRLAALNRSARS